MSETTPLPIATRLWFAWVCLFRVLFDPDFATRAWQAREPEPALPPVKEPPQLPELEPPPKPEKQAAKPEPAALPAPPPPPPTTTTTTTTTTPSAEPALQLLALLQREGRLIDFLQQDIASFSDADIGAAARVIHEGCRKALREHAAIQPVRAEEEGSRVTVAAGFSPAEIKLSGDVGGSPPYSGVLRHRGWRAEQIKLPVPVAGHDPHVLAPAEVEL